MTLTMVGGAMIAGMTPQGSGSITFPVMTFLEIKPSVARDFLVYDSILWNERCDLHYLLDGDKNREEISPLL